MRLPKCIAYGLVLGSILSAPALAVEPEAPEELITRANAVRILVQNKLGQPFREETEYEKADHGAMVEYYADADHETVWVDENGLRPKARLVIKELGKAADWGLDPDDYELPQEIILSANDETPTQRLAEFELKLSHAVLTYARHARGGRFAPQSISKMLDPTLDLVNPIEVINTVSKEDDPAAYLRGLHPKHEQFELLRQALLRARGGTTEEKEKRIVMPRGPVLKPGAIHPHVALLRKRLEVAVPEADVPELAADEKSQDNPEKKAKNPAEVFDKQLVDALKAFQKEKGIAADGVLGPNTRRTLNGGSAAPKNRVNTILANMERWRWIPDNIDKLNIRVNVPEFRFRVFDGEKVLHSERVVVGKTKNPTPVFSDQMEHIVFNPYWNVPNSIKREEILPYLRSGGGGGWFWGGGSSRPRILRAHNLYVKYRGRPINANSVDWSRVNIANYHFYQPPGGANVLGVVKFMFPNKHSVYLHDTPTKNLFSQSVRAYSHGCVRVRNPLKFAEVVLGRDRGWSRGNINAAVASGKNQQVNLNNPIPVHLTYFTARVEKNGKITYFGDIYGHDSRMARAMKL